MADGRPAGQELSRAWFEGVVEPLMGARFAGLPYAAGRLGAGSDVLGLDDEVSQDHDWGLRLTLIVPAHSVTDVRRVVESDIPDSFRGHPARFIPSGGTTPRLHVDVSSLPDFLLPRLGFDPRDGVTVEDWLSLSGQAVLEVVAGPVFRDDDGELTRARSALGWYPDDLWRYALACDWTRLAQELPLMSRAADVGDDRGSRLIAARLVHVTMHLAFLLERRWTPYAKWFGSMFHSLESAADLGPRIDDVLTAADRHAREHGMAAALQLLLELQNRRGLTDVERATIPFWDRGHLHPDPSIVLQLVAPVRDADVRGLRLGLGTIEQRTDSVDLLVDPRLRRAAIRG